jgi:putative NIF3 family GTP cyclohydrolase 1 type 2
VEEMRVEYLVQSHRVGNVIHTLLATHPYEEVAYDLIPIANTDPTIGAGMIGELTQPMEEKDFLNFVKNTFQTGCIRHTDFLNKPIKRVAFCGGAGGFLLNEAKKQQADIFITADYKYHEFFDAENQIVIADIGHFESEQFTTNLIADILKKKFTTFAVHLTGINTNPINYF